jgi:hypothetical protein
MKKDHDLTERFAFHLITSKDIALNIANDGLSCEQLSFSIDKYLGIFTVLIIFIFFVFILKEILMMVSIYRDVQMFY